jgi:hypothetical protein
MAVTLRNGIPGKICPHCDLWKPLVEFPSDSTNGASQGFAHCRCKACRAQAGKGRRLKFRMMKERAIKLGMWDSINARAK